MSSPTRVETDTATNPLDPQASGQDPKRWLALAIIAVSQLMIVLDGSIVNIALPSAQHALHISTANRQWVITAYTLSFGGLLLLGGRIADYLGRKRVFIVGLVGFASASAIGGLAPDAAALFGARALQGAFAALMAPAAWWSVMIAAWCSSSSLTEWTMAPTPGCGRPPVSSPLSDGESADGEQRGEGHQQHGRLAEGGVEGGAASLADAADEDEDHRQREPG